MIDMGQYATPLTTPGSWGQAVLGAQQHNNTNNNVNGSCQAANKSVVSV